MKRHLQIIMVLAMAFVLSACSGRMVNLPVENTKAKKVPAWYLDHEDTGKAVSYTHLTLPTTPYV